MRPQISVDRAGLEPADFDQLGDLPTLRSGESKIEPVRDATLEDGEVIGQRQHRLYHMEVVYARGIHLRQRRGKEIGLLLVVAFDCDAVARLDDSLEQRRRPLGRADFRARVIDGQGPCEAIVPLRRSSIRSLVQVGYSRLRRSSVEVDVTVRVALVHEAGRVAWLRPSHYALGHALQA
jgi:hypothetical protein